MELKIQYLTKDIDKVKFDEGDCGIDLRASGKWIINLDSEKEEIEKNSYEIQPRERILIKTGIKVEIPKGYWGNIRDRSGLAFKYGLHVLAGVIDENYRGEIGIVMVNTGKRAYDLRKNERIAQMIITPYAFLNIVEVEEVSDTSRGEKGFGSSGKN